MLLIAAVATLFLSFLFALGGVGSAAVLVPVLHSLGMALSVARPLGLLINTLTLSSASFVNIRSGKIRVREWLPLLGASLCSAPAGAYASTVVPEGVLLYFFAVFLTLAGLVMLIGIKKTGTKEAMGTGTQLFWGGVSGFISGLLGIGSGGIVVPILGLMNFAPKRIAAITSLIVPVASFSGFMAYLQMGDVSLFLAVVCGGLAVIGGYAGTSIMHRFLSQNSIRTFLACTMLLMACKIVYDML
ncbi:sulfite exporter TauE/SafE family protein [Halodesulfovibrio spirochaetisodalis]|uniref:Probable membrane transporter protein n=1 Tax=Halodesulfovibrio spirochaetisodalis TaxID=1560234 RepID=A0A1B7XG64_9BACT|nr:sulfite exporter TauE/SafE family protein [Halodesulfovibrio spirochaetisodalis]OBQ54500.1 hypothetical protein SP90_05445 [Halodesulfovibrio spirochaetisodalis]